MSTRPASRPGRAGGASAGLQRLARRDVIGVAAVLAVVAALTVHWAPHTFWSPDGLFYEARAEQMRGASKEEALARVWSGPLAAGFRAGDARRAPEDRALADPDWVPYHYDLFDRRLLVPALSLFFNPVAGTESLEVVAAIGVFAFALLLYVLLRRRFSPLASGLAVGACLLWPPMFWAFMPLTESWGLALLCVALLAALLAMEAGRQWLWLWAAAVLALGFSRDFTPVALAAAAALIVVVRNRRSVELGATGLAAALPAPLVGGASLREHLAFSFSGNRIPEDASWSFVADHYLSNIEDGIRRNFEYLFEAEPRFLDPGLPLFPLTVPIVAGIVVLLLAGNRLREDPFLVLMWGALAGGAAYYLLLPHFNYLRYELVFLPAAAAGIAIAVDRLRRWAAEQGASAVEGAPSRTADRPDPG